MSIEAMKQAIEAWDACGRYPDATSDIERLDVAINTLRTAIQQAEAQQPATGIEIDFKQTTELLTMFGGEPATVTLMPGDGHRGKGLYAYYTDLPEEGAEFLGEADDEAVPDQQPATTEPVKAAPYNPTEEMRWAMKRIDPALSSEQCRALWSAAWYAAPSTHPAPSVPDDVRHIVGWWLCNEANPQDGSPWTTEPSQRALDHMKVVSGEKHTVMRLVAIDAAMLAAKQKGGA